MTVPSACQPLRRIHGPVLSEVARGARRGPPWRAAPRRQKSDHSIAAMATSTAQRGVELSPGLNVRILADRFRKISLRFRSGPGSGGATPASSSMRFSLTSAACRDVRWEQHQHHGTVGRQPLHVHLHEAQRRSRRPAGRSAHFRKSHPGERVPEEHHGVTGQTPAAKHPARHSQSRFTPRLQPSHLGQSAHRPPRIAFSVHPSTSLGHTDPMLLQPRENISRGSRHIHTRRTCVPAARPKPVYCGAIGSAKEGTPALSRGRA